jgi:hypothetical protein
MDTIADWDEKYLKESQDYEYFCSKISERESEYDDWWKELSLFLSNSKLPNKAE